MNTIYLLSCVSKKQSYRAKAKDLYISPLFRLSYQFAQQANPDAIFILSAKYGLVHPDQEIDPYDETLNKMSDKRISMWADSVLIKLEQTTDLQNDHFVFLAGLKYRKYLLQRIMSYEIPMEGLTIGRQLQFLSTR